MDPVSDGPNYIDKIVTVIGGVIVYLLVWFGKNRKPDVEPTALLSGALLDNRVVDPLVAQLERLNQNLEREITDKQREAEEERRREEREDIAKAVFEQLRQDMLAHPPADMPTIRKPPAPRKP